MRFYEEKDYDALSQRAANIIAAQIILKPDCVLGSCDRFFTGRNLQKPGCKI